MKTYAHLLREYLLDHERPASFRLTHNLRPRIDAKIYSVLARGLADSALYRNARDGDFSRPSAEVPSNDLYTVSAIRGLRLTLQAHR